MSKHANAKQVTRKNTSSLAANAADAFTETAQERAALSAEELITPNVDVAKAAQTVFGALEALRRHEREVEHLLREHAVTTDALERYALAALHANALDLPETALPAPVAALLDEGYALRELMLDSAELLAKCGHLDAETVAAIRAGTGPTDAANDLIALGDIFRRHWSRLKAMTPVTPEQVRRASELGTSVSRSLGRRAQRSTVHADDCTRAWTLLARAYDEWRRAIGYVRYHEGDADDVAPSPLRNRGRASAPAPTQPEADSGATPAVTNGTATPAVTNGTATPDSTAPPDASAVPAPSG
jgi:hypothetical protein